MKYVFDTTAYSELLRGHQTVAELLKKSDQIYMPNIVIAELGYGFGLGSKQLENQKLLARFLDSKKVGVLLPDNITTTYFVAIALYARKKGIQLSSHDIWIAALTEQWESTLVTFDNDFKYLAYQNLKLWPQK